MPAMCVFQSRSDGDQSQASLPRQEMLLATPERGLSHPPPHRETNAASRGQARTQQATSPSLGRRKVGAGVDLQAPAAPGCRSQGQVGGRQAPGPASHRQLQQQAPTTAGLGHRWLLQLAAQAPSSSTPGRWCVCTEAATGRCAAAALRQRHEPHQANGANGRHRLRSGLLPDDGRSRDGSGQAVIHADGHAGGQDAACSRAGRGWYELRAPQCAAARQQACRIRVPRLMRAPPLGTHTGCWQTPGPACSLGPQSPWGRWTGWAGPRLAARAAAAT